MRNQPNTGLVFTATGDVVAFKLDIMGVAQGVITTPEERMEMLMAFVETMIDNLPESVNDPDRVLSRLNDAANSLTEARLIMEK